MRVVRGLLGAWMLCACGNRSADADRPPVDTHVADTAAPTEPREPTPWPEHLLQILAPPCGGCHGAGGCSSLRCFLDDYAAVTDPANVTSCAGEHMAACIVIRISDGTMPPGGCLPGEPGCITDSEMQVLQEWAADPDR